jgi:hypothetical protein
MRGIARGRLTLRLDFASVRLPTAEEVFGDVSTEASPAALSTSNIMRSPFTFAEGGCDTAVGSDVVTGAGVEVAACAWGTRGWPRAFVTDADVLSEPPVVHELAELLDE